MLKLSRNFFSSLKFSIHAPWHTCTVSWGGSFFSDFISIIATLGFFIPVSIFRDDGGMEVVTVTGCGLFTITPVGGMESLLLWVCPKKFGEEMSQLFQKWREKWNTQPRSLWLNSLSTEKEAPSAIIFPSLVTTVDTPTMSSFQQQLTLTRHTRMPDTSHAPSNLTLKISLWDINIIHIS